ncbi:hypothetical protein CDL12_02327 [Handroanthus impetiginosus]|uniref:Uncharacterized protein n=1 Tax=Handroanthus impetiginosus TaxID=429701 RepID=A0A2G9I5B3_9LAMI|nr:hypothetical protein CDL12_02327 [Handroanthus impetiginosus]
MMALALPAAPSFPHCSSSSSKFTTSAQLHNSLRLFPCRNKTKINDSHAHSKEIIQKRIPNFICRAEKEYKFPDPIPEFADAETEKFRTHLDGKLSKKDMFGDSVNEVVDICTQRKRTHYIVGEKLFMRIH